MQGLTIKQLIQHIEDTAMQHPAVQQFGTGEDFEISPAGDAKPVLVWLEQPFISTIEAQPGRSVLQTIEAQILVLDIPITSNQDLTDILSKTYSVAAWLFMRLQANPQRFTVITTGDQAPSLLSLTNFGPDGAAGWRLECKLQLPLPFDACDVNKFGL